MRSGSTRKPAPLPEVDVCALEPCTLLKDRDYSVRVLIDAFAKHVSHALDLRLATVTWSKGAPTSVVDRAIRSRTPVSLSNYDVNVLVEFDGGPPLASVMTEWSRFKAKYAHVLSADGYAAFVASQPTQELDTAQFAELFQKEVFGGKAQD